MVSTDILNMIGKELNKRFGMSFAIQEDMKELGIIDEIIKNSMNLDEIIKKDYSTILKLMENNHPNDFYRKQLYLEDYAKTNFDYCTDYFLALYLGNNLGYYDSTKFFDSIIKKYNLDYNISKDDLLKKLKEHFTIKENKEIYNKIKHKFSPKNEYDAYSKFYNKNFIDKRYEDFKWMWGEEDTYNVLKEAGRNPIWVSRYYGDGFGYDLLCRHLNDLREMLVEVKTTRGNEVELTDNEYNIMIKSNDHNADYYVIAYYQIDGPIIKTLYKYNPKTKQLLNVIDNSMVEIKPTTRNNELKYVIQN